MAAVGGRIASPGTHETDQAHTTYLIHLPYLTLFVLLTLAFTWPLAASLRSGVIGGAGDNLSFVWNFWWTRTALAAHQSVFWTPALFAPLGTNLATHTLIPLMTVPASLVFPRVPPLELYNGALLLAVFLDFTCAYVAAFTITRDPLASAFAAATFGGAPFLNVRLLGHLNVLSAWGLPLLLAAAVAYTRRPSSRRGIAGAVVLALIAYTDYYDFIFGMVMATAVVFLTRWTVVVGTREPDRARRRGMAAIGVLLFLVLAVLTWIYATGGSDVAIGPLRLQMTDTFNGRVLAGFLAAAFLLAWKWPAVRLSGNEDALNGASLRHFAVFGGVLLFLLLPVLVASVGVWRAGDYSTQAYVWRNAPPGIDVASLFLGNQLHPITGGLTMAAFRHFGMNNIEGAAWLGLVPMALVVFAWKLRARPGVSALFWIGGFFLVWSLGPYLRILGYNTGVMLPQTLLRFIPIAANARIPGRAFAVVQLMAAVLGALVLSSLRETRPGLARALALAAVAGVLVDYWPAPRSVEPIEVPSVYAALKNMPAGAVLEIPFGVRDGFGERGAFDARTLFYQTVHEHPEAGGFVARLSSRTMSRFDSDSILRALLDLSEHRTPPPAGECRESLACSARYVAVNTSTASPELTAFVDRTFALRPVANDDTHTLSAIEHVTGCACR